MQNNLFFLKELLHNGMLRRRLVAVFATDMTMLICFGALFPPLAVIISLSILKDVLSIRLALGRYCEVMEAVQNESVKEQMVKVKDSMDIEILKARAGIWNGVWYGMVVGTWIWGFVLFDTIASMEGVGQGFCLLIGMASCPFFVRYLFQIAIRFRRNGEHRGNKLENKRSSASERPLMNSTYGISMIETYWQGRNSILSTVHNPIVGEESHIEMRISNVHSVENVIQIPTREQYE
jgi:hypothetical protein